MKVLHINTLSTGGAANAVIRLHRGLLQSGIDSRILFLKDRPSYPLDNVDTFVKNKPISMTQRVIKKLTRYKSVQEKEREKLASMGGHYESVSFPLTNYKVEDHAWINEVDIIHLHWVANFINYSSFFKNTNKPIVWTLHDMNPFMGIFHYDDDLALNSREYGSFEKRCIDIKLEALSAVNSLTIVTPSQWLKCLSSQSNILHRYPHKVIQNGIDTEVFKPYNKILARQVFNLPEDKMIFLFASENINNRRKGLDLLLRAFQLLGDKNEAALCAVGNMKEKIKLKNLYCTGPIHDERLMALLYSAADAFVLPSREDNLPNVMIESLGCGTPVISFSIGGMKETIIPLVNGLLAKDLSAVSLQEELHRFLTRSGCFDGQEIRKLAVEKFSLQRQAATYTRLYEKILTDKKINDPAL